MPASFQPSDDKKLVQYLAVHNPAKPGRLGNAIYEQLVHLGQSSNEYAWATAHTAKSWRERYKTSEARFDNKILRYQNEHHMNKNGLQNLTALADVEPPADAGRKRARSSDVAAAPTTLKRARVAEPSQASTTPSQASSKSSQALAKPSQPPKRLSQTSIKPSQAPLNLSQASLRSHASDKPSQAWTASSQASVKPSQDQASDAHQVESSFNVVSQAPLPLAPITPPRTNSANSLRPSPARERSSTPYAPSPPSLEPPPCAQPMPRYAAYPVPAPTPLLGSVDMLGRRISQLDKAGLTPSLRPRAQKTAVASGSGVKLAPESRLAGGWDDELLRASPAPDDATPRTADADADAPAARGEGSRGRRQTIAGAGPVPRKRASASTRRQRRASAVEPASQSYLSQLLHDGVLGSQPAPTPRPAARGGLTVLEQLGVKLAVKGLGDRYKFADEVVLNVLEACQFDVARADGVLRDMQMGALERFRESVGGGSAIASGSGEDEDEEGEGSGQEHDEAEQDEDEAEGDEDGDNGGDDDNDDDEAGGGADARMHDPEDDDAFDDEPSYQDGPSSPSPPARTPPRPRLTHQQRAHPRVSTHGLKYTPAPPARTPYLPPSKTRARRVVRISGAHTSPVLLVPNSSPMRAPAPAPELPDSSPVRETSSSPLARMGKGKARRLVAVPAPLPADEDGEDEDPFALSAALDVSADADAVDVGAPTASQEDRIRAGLRSYAGVESLGKAAKAHGHDVAMRLLTEWIVNGESGA